MLLEQRIEGKIPKIFESLHLICDEDSVLISGKPKLAPRGNIIKQLIKKVALRGIARSYISIQLILML